MASQKEERALEITESSSQKDFSAHSPRERILAAALKLFVEQGYFNTNVPDLSRESRCSVGSIYHTFKNKEEVAKALYGEAMKAFRLALGHVIPQSSRPDEIIMTTVRSFLEFSEVNHQLSRYIWLCRHNEFMTGLIKHPTGIGFDTVGRTLARAIKQGIRDGQIQNLSPHVIWSIIFGIPLAYVRDWLDGYNPVPPSKAADDIALACWNAIRIGTQK